MPTPSMRFVPLLLLLLAPHSHAWEPPGQALTTLESLDPTFREPVQRVLKRLTTQGHRPRLISAYRDPVRQQFIYDVGQIMQWFGRPPITNAQAGQSCHNHSTAEGAPAAWAVDVVPGPGVSTAEGRATFFHALGKAATAEGLSWGGAWPKRNPTWKRYGLGWDPGHIQSPQCHH